MGIVTEEEKEAQNRFHCSFVEHSEEEREKQKGKGQLGLCTAAKWVEESGLS